MNEDDLLQTQGNNAVQDRPGGAFSAATRPKTAEVIQKTEPVIDVTLAPSNSSGQV